jgi:CheY-like chemotaxis protein
MGRGAVSGPRYVLVVDDESLVRWSLGEVLAACGHIVVTAADGQTALGLLSAGERNPDVVLLDYRLPEIDGLTLVPLIRARAPGARIVVVTSYGSLDVVHRALALGVERVVDKPIDIADVAELVA